MAQDVPALVAGTDGARSPARSAPNFGRRAGHQGIAAAAHRAAEIAGNSRRPGNT